MKKIIFISVIFIAVLFLITPAIPASQYSMVTEAKEEQFKQEFNLPLDYDIDFESLSDFEQIISESKDTITSSLFQNLKNLIKNEKLTSDPDEGGDPEPQALILLGLFVYTVLIWIMFKIVLFVFSDISSFFRSIFDNIKSKIVNFFSKIVEFIISILTVLGAAAGGILNIVVAILLSILALAAGAVKLVVNIIIFILFGIIKIAGLIWNTIGTIVALFFDILLLIFQTIFPNFNGS